MISIEAECLIPFKVISISAEMPEVTLEPKVCGFFFKMPLPCHSGIVACLSKDLG